MKNPVPFAILGNARSGTNLLINKLLQTNEVLMGWEPFNQNFFGFDLNLMKEQFLLSEDVCQKMNDNEFRNQDPNAYLEYCLGFKGTFEGKKITAVGIKVFEEHNKEIFWKLSQDKRIKIILMNRRSVLSAYSSLMIAIQTNEWAALLKENVNPEQFQIHFDATAFVHFQANFCDRINTLENNLVKFGVEFVKIDYEDLISDNLSYARVLNFLGISSTSISTATIFKQNSKNVLDRFTNPDDVLPFLRAEQD